MRERAQRFDPRQNMNRRNFEIFHYRDSKAGGVEVHHHDFYEVYFFLDGKMDYWVDGRVYSLESGDLLLINPMELHRPMVEPDGAVYERIVLWIDKNYLEGFSNENASLTRCFDTALSTHTNLLRPSAGSRSDIKTWLRQLVSESYGSDYAAEIYAQGVLLQFMAQLNRIAMGEESRRSENAAESALAAQVLEYINEHYSETVSLDELAKRFYVSKYHLSHEFSRAVGTSIYRYVMLKRLLIAKQLLGEGEAPGEVCAKCGFKDYTNFYRAFKSEYGAGPREYLGGEG